MGSCEEAFRLLRKTSTDRNQKIRDLARTLVDGVGICHKSQHSRKARVDVIH
ncbi:MULTISPECIES: ANTAR domain-containing protein [Micrococcaceae]|uniref:ANTAR domain-containing protein n=1 Tax=Micrococcaceae TaxID=1268 RepID=UPI0035A89BF9